MHVERGLLNTMSGVVKSVIEKVWSACRARAHVTTMQSIGPSISSQCFPFLAWLGTATGKSPVMKRMLT